jgi:hypothetical protein
MVIIEWKDLALPFGPAANIRVKKETIKEMATHLGLHLEEEFFAGTYHYGLIFTKV